ncbi:(R)-citramalate synthase [Nymphon striatum]|nr:(R)-citramalate synthase [Nymphon striatum]
MRGASGWENPYFSIESFNVDTNHRGSGSRAWNEANVEVETQAVIKLWVNDERYVGIGEGNGPVNALDTALRQVLLQHYPSLEDMVLTDYKVRVLDTDRGTGAVTRVLLDTTRGDRSWTTIGVSANLIESSWQALIDSIIYGLSGSLGSHVVVEPFFFVVIALLGFNAGSVARIAVWAFVVFVSVMWHELGHAFAARRLGSKPRITLHGFGGLTHWQPPQHPTRWNLISVAVAGPLAGMVLGLAVWGGSQYLEPFADTDVRFFVQAMIWVNLGWGMLNLLPVLPLDGGHVMREVLPGAPPVRYRRAAWASVIFGAVVARWLFGWAVASNLTLISTERKAETLGDDLGVARRMISELADGTEVPADELRDSVVKLPQEYQAGFKLAAVEAALFGNQPATARAMLNRVPGNADPAMYALVSAAETHGQQGVVELGEMLSREPTAYRSRWLALGLWFGGRLPEVVHHLAALDRNDKTSELLTAAADIAEWAGDATVVSQLSGLRS